MRQRIVINLDAAQAPPAKSVRKRGRWQRVLTIFGFVVLSVVVVAALGGFLLLRRYQSTPTYALALIFDAAQRNDVDEFKKRIDNEEITRNMIASVSQKAAARYGYAINSSIQQQIDSSISSPPPHIKQAVQDEFFRAMKAFAAAPHQQPFISLIGAVQKFMTVTTEGNSAKATGKMAGHNLELALRHDADGWKVIDVKDELIVQRVVDIVMKELPPIGNIDANSPLLKKPQRKRSGRGR